MVTESKRHTSLGLTITQITRHLMDKFDVDQEEAYKKLIATDFYILLTDYETDLYLEPTAYLCICIDLELDCGTDAMYDYIGRV